MTNTGTHGGERRLRLLPPLPADPDNTGLPGAAPEILTTLAGEERSAADRLASPPRLRQRPRPGPSPADIICAAGSATCLTVIVFGLLTGWHGALGFFATDYALFLAALAVITGLNADGEAVRDRLMTVVATSGAAVLFGALACMVVFTVWRGHPALLRANFWTQDMTAAGPLDPLSVGGIRHALVGTGEQTGLALVFTGPLGLACAIYISEVHDRFAGFIRTLAEAMTALPSIVAGLFIYMTAILTLGLERSGLAAALAISVMMLPIVIRSADVVLRLVPHGLREAATAMGASHRAIVWRVVLPNARSGLVTAIIMSTARGIGETSPLLLTAGATNAVNADPLHGPQVSLPLAAFQLVQSPEQTMIARGFATAAALLLLVLVLFTAARIAARSGGAHGGALARRRLRIRSARDSQRIDARHAAAVEQARDLQDRRE